MEHLLLGRNIGRLSAMYNQPPDKGNTTRNHPREATQVWYSIILLEKTSRFSTFTEPFVQSIIATNDKHTNRYTRDKPQKHPPAAIFYDTRTLVAGNNKSFRLPPR